jgi:hypothetical protein
MNYAASNTGCLNGELQIPPATITRNEPISPISLSIGRKLLALDCYFSSVLDGHFSTHAMIATPDVLFMIGAATLGLALGLY